LAIEAMKKGYADKKLQLDDKETMWLDMLGETVAAMPSDVGQLTEEMLPRCEKLDPKKYDLA